MKAAALHAVALVLSPPKTSSSSTAAAASASVINPLPSGGGSSGSGSGHGDADGDGDAVMGNTPAAEGTGAESGGDEERSSLRRMMFERVAVCNNRQTTGALLLDLARQPVPEVCRYIHTRCQ